MKVSSQLFEHEGTENLGRTLEIVAKAVALYSIDKVVAFTALGEGSLRLRDLLPSPDVRIIAVTLPAESFAKTGDDKVSLGIPDAKMRESLSAAGIPIVQAAMPFRGFDAASVSSTARVIRQALAIFGGGMNLCVQAVLMACDAGYVSNGQRCIAFSGDTAIIARAAHTHSFLTIHSRFAVEHILCKPLHYQITRSSQPIEIQKQVTPERLAPGKPSRRKRKTSRKRQ